MSRSDSDSSGLLIQKGLCWFQTLRSNHGFTVTGGHFRNATAVLIKIQREIDKAVSDSFELGRKEVSVIHITSNVSMTFRMLWGFLVKQFQLDNWGWIHFECFLLK